MFRNLPACRLLLAVLLPAMACLPAAALRAEGMPRGVLIIDGSGSMWGRVGGVEKISVVRTALPEALSGLAGALDLGLVSYGHRQRRDCRDIELILPPTALDPASFAAAVGHLLPRGKTPIASALKLAVEAVDAGTGSAQSHVVLIADGTENCNLDPCAFATEMATTRPDIVFDVIALGISDKEEAGLRCIAAPSAGQFRRVDDAPGLTAAIGAVFAGTKTAAAQAAGAERSRQPPGLYLSASLASDTPPLEKGVSWRVYRKGETSAAGATPLLRDGASAPVLALEPGDYHIEARFGPLMAAGDVSLRKDAAVPLRLSFEAGVVTAEVRLGADRPAGDDAVLTLYDASKGIPGADNVLAHRRRNDAVFHLPPGSYSLKARVGEAEMRSDFPLRGGESLQLPLLLEAGELTLSTRLATGQPPLDDVEYTIYRRGAGGDGAYEEFLRTLDAAPRLVLPAGAYLVHATTDAAAVSESFTLAVGESRQLDLDLKAGVVRLSALLAGREPGVGVLPAFTVERAIADAAAPASIAVAGNRVRALEPPLPAGSSRDRFVLPAGTYRIRTQFGNSNAVSVTDVVLGAGEEKRIAAEVGAGRLQLALALRAGDPPLSGVFWSVFDATGQQVASASRPTPVLFLRDGAYTLVADHLGKAYSRKFDIRAGDDRKIEIVVE